MFGMFICLFILSVYKAVGFGSVHFSKTNKDQVFDRRFKLFVFDMDSTLIDGETINQLAAAAGVEKQVSEITESAMRGEIDFEQSLQKRVSLLRGLSVEDAYVSVSNISIMRGADELLSYIRSLGGVTLMVTCGFDIAAISVGEQLNIDYVYSNSLVSENGHLTGEVSGPLTETNAKVKILDEVVRRLGISYDGCVVVGDGANDICMFDKAGLSIAFNAKPSVIAAADVSISDKDLRCVIPVIQDALQSRNKILESA